MRRMITPTQMTVLQALEREGVVRRPRGSLERLAKKGLVEGDRREGWRLTDAGKVAVVSGTTLALPELI